MGVRKVEHLTLESEVAGDTSWPKGKQKTKKRVKVKGDICTRGKGCSSSVLCAPMAPHCLHPTLTALNQGCPTNPVQGARQAPDMSSDAATAG